MSRGERFVGATTPVVSSTRKSNDEFHPADHFPPSLNRPGPFKVLWRSDATAEIGMAEDQVVRSIVGGLPSVYRRLF
jgi:hypothetical protein